MQLKDLVCCQSDEVWELFEPILPSAVGCGNSRKPKTNRDCFHALMYVLMTGIGLF